MKHKGLKAFSDEQLIRQYTAIQEKLPEMNDMVTWKAFFETACAIAEEAESRGIILPGEYS